MYSPPPERPWDFSTFSQNKRPWDFSPPFPREVHRRNILSTRLTREAKEECSSANDSGIRTICGFFPDNQGIGRQRGNGDAVQSSTKSRMDANKFAQEQANPTSPNQIEVAQEDAHRSFWAHEKDMSIDVLSTKEPSQNHDLQSRTFVQQGESFSEQRRKVLQLIFKMESELQEIEGLKARMAMLCEKLALYVINERSDKDVTGDILGSEEYKRLNGIAALKKLVNERDPVSLPNRGKELKEDCVGVKDADKVCHNRSKTCKFGLCAILQSFLWCTGLILTILRNIDTPPCAPPT